jgi:hypothetical protein
MLTVYPLGDTISVSGKIETAQELEIAREALGPSIFVGAELSSLRDDNGVFYRYQAIEIGNYVSWMVYS